MSKSGKAKVGRIATRTFGSVRRFGARAHAAGDAGLRAARKAWDEYDQAQPKQNEQK
jgi:hypothetical protein